MADDEEDLAERRGRTILVVEDHTTIRRMLADGLRARAFTVAEADGIGPALRILSSRTIHAIVLDIGLAGESGVEVARFAAGLRRPPIVLVVTGQASRPEVIELFSLGVCGIWEKPVSCRDVEEYLASDPLPLSVHAVARSMVGRLSLADASGRVRDLMVQQAMNASGSNVDKAARLLGVSRQAVYQRARPRRCD